MSTFLHDRRGFCVQFATTYAVMARLAGIPARVAIGFTPGTRDAKGIYHVTNYESHAWPEVWLAGLGWTDQFDPTPAGPQPGESHLPGEPPNVGASTPPSTPVPTTAPAATTPGPSGTPNGGGVSSPPVSPGRGVTVTRSPTGGGVSALGGVLLIAALVFVGLALTAAVVVARKRRRRTRRRAGIRPGHADRRGVGRGRRRAARGRCGVAGVPHAPGARVGHAGADRRGDRGTTDVVGPSVHRHALRRGRATLRFG